jgi:hypothetical protein
MRWGRCAGRGQHPGAQVPRVGEGAAGVQDLPGRCRGQRGHRVVPGQRVKDGREAPLEGDRHRVVVPSGAVLAGGPLPGAGPGPAPGERAVPGDDPGDRGPPAPQVLARPPAPLREQIRVQLGWTPGTHRFSRCGAGPVVAGPSSLREHRCPPRRHADQPGDAVTAPPPQSVPNKPQDPEPFDDTRSLRCAPRASRERAARSDRAMMQDQCTAATANAVPMGV